MPTPPPLVVSAVAVVRDRRLLTVTARGRDVVYLPGGKVDPGETGREAAVREAQEELGVDAVDLAELFTVRTQAHGEPDGRLVHMTVYSATLLDEPRPSGEIDALHWIASADAGRCPPAGRETLARLHGLGLID